jgi:hypothetical protein
MPAGRKMDNNEFGWKTNDTIDVWCTIIAILLGSSAVVGGICFLLMYAPLLGILAAITVITLIAIFI